MAAPPDLRVLCKRLTSTPPDELPRLCPVLVGHVLRCGGPLSATQDAKGKDKSSETPVLVHKLKTSITTLLTGRNSSGRFAAICLIKAVIDVGGWECLRAAGTWIAGLISVIQKSDPYASKQLAIVTLTRIYSLLHGYQTLTREMATPTLPSFVTACIQLIKTPASGKPLMSPVSLIETIICSLFKIVTLYPTTLRPSTAPIKAAIKVFMAPTSTDTIVVSKNLRRASRRLSVLLHHTAAKNGSSEEWAKGIASSIKECHITADHVLRAVHESWESSTGYKADSVSLEGEPSGGGDSSDDLPAWTGLGAGSERLVGLLDLLAEYLRAPTKAAVTVPIGALLDLASRLTLVTPPNGSEETVNTNVAIGRDEKAELWSALPDIHTAVMRLHTAIIHRLQENVLPLSTDLIDQMVRLFNSNRQIASVREATYILAKEILSVSGPTLPKLTVDSLTLLIQACCQDILLAAGHLEEKTPEAPTTTTTNGTNNKPPQQKGSLSNADDYLTTTASNSSTSFSVLSPTHQTAAAKLLPLFLSHLPQRHLSPDARGLADRTAILSDSKPAMLASCLYPYKDSRGRYYPSILPFLVRRFPRDQEVEVLRTNLLRAGRHAVTASHEGEWDPREGLDDLLKEQLEMDNGAGREEGDGEVMVTDDTATVPAEAQQKPKAQSGWGDMDVDAPAAAVSASTNAFFVASTTTTATQNGPGSVAPMKRKAEEEAAAKPKREKVEKIAGQEVEVTIMPKASSAAQAQPVGKEEEDGDDSDSEGSIQIDMTMEDGEDDEDDE